MTKIKSEWAEEFATLPRSSITAGIIGADWSDEKKIAWDDFERLAIEAERLDKREKELKAELGRRQKQANKTIKQIMHKIRNK